MTVSSSNRHCAGFRSFRKPRALCAVVAALLLGVFKLSAAGVDAAGAAAPAPVIYIAEYRVQGVHSLPKIEIEEAVYPFLGPARTEADVEQARKALEKLYRDKGLQAVDVEIPAQNPALVRRGIVILEVSEGVVGRLRVRGARYFLPSEVKRGAPSLAEGKVVDFNNITKDILGLNRFGDRRVTPALHQGVEPGTEDIDLNVQDTLPLHGSLELNNRYNANTTHWRVNGAVSYSNLWQLGQTLGASFQVAPERIKDASVYSGYYLLPVPSVEGLSFMLQGTEQDSDVASLGSADSIGRGQTIGAHALFTLPSGKNFFHSISAGFDYKHYEATDVTARYAGGEIPVSPVTYYPLSLSYTAGWTNEKRTPEEPQIWSTDLDATVTLSIRGTSYTAPADRGPTAFNDIRYNADDDFITLRGDLSHTHELPAGLQVFGRIQGQIASGPLVPGEQFSAGGLDSVRGYLESAALGDDGFVSTIELRSPSFGALMHRASIDDLRCFMFFDQAVLKVRQALPEQTSSFQLAGYGGGAMFKLYRHFDGSLTLGVPLIGQGATKVHEPLFTFRVWGDF